MKSRPPHQRLFGFLLLALALTCIIGPFLTLGADCFMTQWPALMRRRIPFHRTFDRAFMVSGAVLFFLFRRVLISTELKKLGSSRNRVGADFLANYSSTDGSSLSQREVRRDFSSLE